MQGLFGRVHGGEGLAIFPGQWFHGQAMDAGMVNNSTYAVNFGATEIMQGCMKGARGYNYKHSDIRKRGDCVFIINCPCSNWSEKFGEGPRPQRATL